jgi:hypothetical protein
MRDCLHTLLFWILICFKFWLFFKIITDCFYRKLRIIMLLAFLFILFRIICWLIWIWGILLFEDSLSDIFFNDKEIRLDKFIIIKHLANLKERVIFRFKLLSKNIVF